MEARGLYEVGDYREQLLESNIEFSASQSQRLVVDSEAGSEQIRVGPSSALEWLESNYDEIIPEMHGGIWIRAAIQRMLEGRAPEDFLDQWWFSLISKLLGLEEFSVVLIRGEHCLRGRLDGGSMGECKHYGDKICLRQRERCLMAMLMGCHIQT